MKNIKKIYERLTESLVKSRALTLFISVQNITLALLSLIYANVLISGAKVSGELDYERVKIFYNVMIYILFALVFIYAPYFLAGSLNSLQKNNTIEYLLSTKMKLKEITYASFLRGIANVIILIFSAFPIASISIYFGGVGVLRALRLVVCLVCFAFILSSISLYISSFYKERGATVLLSYVISFFVFIIHMIFVKYILNVGFITFLYFVFSVILSLSLIGMSYRGRIFKE